MPATQSIQASRVKPLKLIGATARRFRRQLSLMRASRDRYRLALGATACLMEQNKQAGRCVVPLWLGAPLADLKRREKPNNTVIHLHLGWSRRTCCTRFATPLSVSAQSAPGLGRDGHSYIARLLISLS